MKQKEVCMEMDLQEIDYFKIISLFNTFKGRSLQINVIGTIVIPFWINNFDWYDYGDRIGFGEFEDEEKWFILDKAEDLNDVWNKYDDFSSEDNIIFKIKCDVFTTWIHIVCGLEGIEMYE